jgi:hypothetical protein
MTGEHNLTKSSNFIKKLFTNYSEAINDTNFGPFLSWHTSLLLWRLDFMFYIKSSKFYATQAKFFDPEGFSDHKGIIATFHNSK